MNFIENDLFSYDEGERAVSKRKPGDLYEAHKKKMKPRGRHVVVPLKPYGVKPLFKLVNEDLETNCYN